MQTQQGTVSGLKSSVEISGGGNDTQVSTTHVTCFQLDNVPVMLKTGSPAMIDNGNKIAVSGGTNGGVFRALAYRNMTTGATGSGRILAYILPGIVFIIATIFMYPQFNTPFFGGIPQVVFWGIC